MPTSTHFDSKAFNPEVFQRYMERVPNLKLNRLLESGAIRTRQELAANLSDNTAGNYISTPLLGLVDGAPLNYDGQTDITATSTVTYMHSRVVTGRAKAWEEKDFSYDITGGVSFMENIAQQVSSYWNEVDQDTIVSTLKGVFSMSDTQGKKFVESHTADITGVTNLSGKVGHMDATTLNSAVQKASGDHKGLYNMILMHSAVATYLENMNLLTYVKENDANGMLRDTGMATLNGRSVIVDDSMPVESGYVISAEGVTGALKVVASDATDGQITLANVKKGDYYPAGVAANDYVLPQTRYISYILGSGAIEYTNCGVMVPYEMDRDPAKFGGKDILYTRQRKVWAPYGISFLMTSMASASPTSAELELGTNWGLVKSLGSVTKYIDTKAIPIVRVLSLG